MYVLTLMNKPEAGCVINNSIQQLGDLGVVVRSVDGRDERHWPSSVEADVGTARKRKP